MVRYFRVKNFWLTFFIVLTALSIGLAVFFAVSYSNKIANMQSNVISNESVYKRRVENNYRQTLYTVEDSLKNMDSDLGKIALSMDKSMQTERLLNVVCHANNLSSSLAHLPVSASENLDKIETFANQTGDYAISLIKKLQAGEALGTKEKATLLSLDSTCSRLYQSVKEFVDRRQGQTLADRLFADSGGDLADMVSGIDSKVFEYEKLIYDGPYSDSIKQAELACTKDVGNDVREKIVKDKFGASSVEFVGQVRDKGVTYVYNLQTNQGNGRVVLACDGKLVEYELSTKQACKYNIDSKQAIAAAEEFCKKQGFDVKAVWVSALADDVIYVNLAPIVDDAVIYCDLVKVAVSCDGLVVGAETRAYLTNHQNHSVKFGKLTKDEVPTFVDKGANVANVRKAIVNKMGKEFACFEVECSFEGNQYFIYIDSNNGKEVEIFKVIEGTEGHTVM